MSMFLAVLLAWDLSTGVTGYKIYWRFGGDDWGSHVVDVGNVTQAEIDEPWPNGSKVEFRCTAYNATGESGPSNVVEWHVTGNNNQASWFHQGVLARYGALIQIGLLELFGALVASWVCLHTVARQAILGFLIPYGTLGFFGSLALSGAFSDIG